MKKSLKILFFCYFPLISFAQLPNEKKPEGQLKREIYGGLTLSTNGWGVNFQFAKRKTNRYKVMYGFSIGNIRNEKEHKAFNSVFKDAKGYYYGKLNSLLAFRPFYGGKILLFEKIRDKGVEIDFVWAAGLSLGLLKPVYLKVRKLDLNTSTFYNAEERYDPSIHHPENIYGRAPWYKGLGKASFLPGLFLKTGVYFDISTRRQLLWGIELGSQIDIYFQKVPLMYQVKNQYVFPSLYANITIGKRFL
jgi:hypothetical protein